MKKIARNPDVVWREEEEAREEVINAMARGEDASAEGTVLLIVSAPAEYPRRRDLAAPRRDA